MVRSLLGSSDRPSTNGDAGRVAVERAVVSVAGPTRRKPSWVLLGSLLVAVAGLVGAWVFAATSEQMSIMVAARDIAPGDVIDTADLRVVEVGRSGELRAVASSRQDLLLGRAARGPIPAGTVLNVDLLADRGQVVPRGMVVVGAALDAGAAPVAGLRAGDRVDVLEVQRAVGVPVTDAVAPVAVVLTPATVWAVEAPVGSSSSASWLVSLLVPADAQGAVAQAAADGLLRLSLVGSDQ